jgi:hypothetical protein
MRIDDTRSLIDFMMARIPTDVDNHPDALPLEFSLDQNFPNPFNPATTIKLTLPRRTRVELDVYNILGQNVRTLLDKEMDVGSYDIVWDGRDKFDRQVASGIYFYRIKAGDYSKTRKMVLLK